MKIKKRMEKIAWHTTRDKKGIMLSRGFIHPIRLPNVYLFKVKADAVHYKKEFGYEAVLAVKYDTADVEREWKPKYATGGVIKMKKGLSVRKVAEPPQN